MEQLFFHLLNISITATWMILAVLLLRLVLKNAPKWTRGVLWGLVALRLICPFSVESALSLIPSTETVSPDIVYADNPAITSGVSVINQTVNPLLTNTLSPNPADSVNPLQVIGTVAALIWIVGLTALLLYAAISYWRVRRRVREAVPAENGAWLCDHIASPFILGILRPRIFVPSALNTADTALVLAHETAHIKRKDHWWKPLGFLLLTVYWFNPVMWIAYYLLCRDIEMACDEKVMKALGEDTKKPYARTLLACSMPRRLIAACPLAFGETAVKGRVKNILHYKKPALWIILVSIIACVITAVCLLTNPVKKDPAFPIGAYRLTGPLGSDGRFSFVMTGEEAPEITVGQAMTVQENGKKTPAGGAFKSISLTSDSFDRFLGTSFFWENGKDTVTFRKAIDRAWIRSFGKTAAGIFPYLVATDNNGQTYLAYANVENGTISGVRWIFAMQDTVTGTTSSDARKVLNALKRNNIAYTAAASDGGMLGGTYQAYSLSEKTERLYTYSYDSKEAAKADCTDISENGCGIMATDPTGTKAYRQVDFAAAPHWYRYKTVIVLYVGENKTVTNALSSVCGEAFAGEAS